MNKNTEKPRFKNHAFLHNFYRVLPRSRNKRCLTSLRHGLLLCKLLPADGAGPTVPAAGGVTAGGGGGGGDQQRDHFLF